MLCRLRVVLSPIYIIIDVSHFISALKDKIDETEADIKAQMNKV